MRVTTHTDYALRTLIFVACYPERRITTHDVAAAYDISVNHLLKIVNQLGSLGYLNVARGHGGGLTLGRDARKISIGDVTRDFEPDLDLVECFDPQADRCTISKSCRLKSVLGDALDAFFAVLDDHTLADIVARRATALRRLLD